MHLQDMCANGLNQLARRVLGQFGALAAPDIMRYPYIRVPVCIGEHQKGEYFLLVPYPALSSPLPPPFRSKSVFLLNAVMSPAGTLRFKEKTPSPFLLGCPPPG